MVNNKPKRPKNAYMFFTADRRKDMPKNASMAETSKLLGAEWKKLSDSGKDKYNKLVKKDKTRYEKEMKKYKPPPSDSDSSSDDYTDDISSEEEQRKPVKKPRKTTTTGYMVFCKEKRSSLQGQKQSEIMKQLGAGWKALSDSQKESYKTKASNQK